MILQSLVQYYEALEGRGEITKPGWCRAKVSFALDLSEQGELLGVIPLKIEETRGKKTIFSPQKMNVPEMVPRAAGIAANFLCDNSSYLLGVDNKGKPKRSLECFLAEKVKHQEVLARAVGVEANAILRFFETWKPEAAEENAVLKNDWEEILAGGNLVFSVNSVFAQDVPAIRRAWERYLEAEAQEEDGICLVTGKRAEIARIHGTIRGVQGAQSSGAALVSFNAPAFESYGKGQSYNAPVGKYAVYAYTTALQYLLYDKTHVSMVGDTTVVYWSADGNPAYQFAFSAVTEPVIDNQELVSGVFRNLESGAPVSVEEIAEKLDMEQQFYILGLAPNAARLAVRFFYQNSFGSILNNIKGHYDRMQIVKPAADTMEYLGNWRLLYETVNKKSRDKKPSANMAGAVYRSILSGDRYPASLYQGVLGRIRAEQDDKDNHSYKITRGRAAIIKAYLLRNSRISEEELTVGLNEESKNVPYTLGRIFAVLEEIQENSNQGINATIKDRYFNSACATPALIFPILFKLKNSHIRKISNVGGRVNYEKLLGNLQAKIALENEGQQAYPKRLALEEQGMFILGYYHQTQKRYEKKVKEEI